jgi:sporulation protein YlmC with PRC-barrel domain
VQSLLGAKVRSVVTEIWVHTTRVTHLQRVAQVQIHLRNGTVKKLVVQHRSGLRAKSRRST